MSVRVNSLLLLPVGLVVAGCAAISAPEGGTRDTVVPRLLSSTPASGATNVSQQSIRLEFSEPVQLKELQKNLLVTPNLAEDNNYKIREERNAIELRFDKPLDPNTTYVFNFNEAVVDITESNVARNVVLAFSTGASLDSGSVRGTVAQLLSGKPEADALIALYPTNDTTDIKRNRPYYIGRTDKSGAFQLRNLREGSYRIYALLDKNQNSRFDEPERIAYLPGPVELRPKLDSLRLLTVRPDSRRALILSQQGTQAYYRIGYGEGLRDITVKALGQATSPALNEALLLTEKGRTVTLFRTPAVAAGRYLVSAVDSAGNVGADTVNVRFDGQAAAPRKGPQYQVVGSPREVARNGQLRLQFNEPVRLATNKPFATLVEDSTTRRSLRVPADGSLSPDRTRLVINMNTRARKTLTLLLDTSSVSSVTGLPLNFRPIRLRPTDQAATGSLSGTVQTKVKSYFLQLLDQNQDVVVTLTNPRTFRFDHVDPGTYSLRVLIDANGDGRWQGGDPNLRILAEPVWNFNQPQQVRANWEIENLRLSF